MILICLFAAVAGLIAYFVTARLGRVTRIVIAFLVFLVPTVAMVAFSLIVGDRARPGSVTVRTFEPADEVGR